MDPPCDGSRYGLYKAGAVASGGDTETHRPTERAQYRVHDMHRFD